MLHSIFYLPLPFPICHFLDHRPSFFEFQELAFNAFSYLSRANSLATVLGRDEAQMSPIRCFGCALSVSSATAAEEPGDPKSNVDDESMVRAWSSPRDAYRFPFFYDKP